MRNVLAYVEFSKVVYADDLETKQASYNHDASRTHNDFNQYVESAVGW